MPIRRRGSLVGRTRRHLQGPPHRLGQAAHIDDRRAQLSPSPSGGGRSSIDVIATAEAKRAYHRSVVSEEDDGFGTVTTSTLASCMRLIAPAVIIAAAGTASTRHGRR